MSNRRYNQFFYTPHAKPVIIDCSFKVAASDSAGNGITGLSGTGVSAVYMHTSATASAGNPNPANGVIIVQLSNKYNKFLGMEWSVESPLTGTPVTTAVANTSYVITVLGTTTTAQWQAVGLPVGVTPAVGCAFTATASQAIGGTGSMQSIATAGSGFDHLEVFGNPTTTLFPTGIGAGNPQILMQAFKEHVISAPADNSVILLQLYLSASSLSTGY